MTLSNYFKSTCTSLDRVQGRVAVGFGPALLLAALCLPLAAQTSELSVPNEPVNLASVKHNLALYHEDPSAKGYNAQLQGQIDKAMAFLRESFKAKKPDEMLALVLDIDETSLSNWPVEQHDDFGYIPTDSNWLIKLRANPAIEPTLELFREASRLHVAVFFITGRPESQRPDTEANLKAVGYTNYQRVYMREASPPASESVADFKSSQRKLILNQGYRIVLNVGDQMSDLVGTSLADHSVKLPNPFYFIP